MALEIPVVSDKCSATDFLSESHPFILRNSSIGECSKKWSAEYLSDKLGKEKVKIHVSKFPKLDFINKNFSYKTLLFEELLERASCIKQENNYFLSETEYYYLRSVGDDPRKDVASIQRQFPSVSEDLIFPDFVPEKNIFSSVFRIASKGLSVWTHYDVMDNALIQIKGCKRAVLFPPTEVPYLYLNGDKSEVLNIDEPNLELYPKFCTATRYESCLCPGDVLYIPAFWFHNMEYLDFGIAVNVFWKELDPVFYDKKDPYGNKDLLPAQQAFNSLDKGLAGLSKLPEKYRKFYYLRLIEHVQKKLKTL